MSVKVTYTGVKVITSWDGLKNDPRWQDIENLPKEGRTVAIAYWDGDVAPRYDIVVWSNDLLNIWEVIRWFYVE